LQGPDVWKYSIFLQQIYGFILVKKFATFSHGNLSLTSKNFSVGQPTKCKTGPISIGKGVGGVTLGCEG